LKVKNSIHTRFKLQGKSFSLKEDLIIFSKEISSEVSLFLKEWFNEKSFVEVKTSGSTGTSKVIKIQKLHMIQSAKATGAFFNLVDGTTALLCMSPTYIAGKMMLVRALVLGWEIDVVKPISSPLFGLKKEYDFGAMVPLQLYNSLDQIHQIKKLIVGGGVVSNEISDKIQGVSTAIYATYGMTETITHIAIKKLNNFSKIDIIKSHSEPFEGEIDHSRYKTLPNIKISKDSRGCLVINAPKISNQLIITNDLVELISETEFKWLGRYDSIINSGGIKLIPEQIEEKLSVLINERFFVAGLSDTCLGEKLVLIIEFKSSNDLKSQNLFLQRIKELESLSKYETPKEIYFISKFIETPTQKINKRETLKLIKSTY